MAPLCFGRSLVVVVAAIACLDENNIAESPTVLEHTMQASRRDAGRRQRQRSRGPAGVRVSGRGERRPFAAALVAAGGPLSQHPGSGTADRLAQGRQHHVHHLDPATPDARTTEPRQGRHRRWQQCLHRGPDHDTRTGTNRTGTGH
uniref:Putative secreted protein n=1 Tax=Anopheles triannulatus TaxID=58253 RepID=A0A2M4B3F8_9DIPT